MPPIFDDGCISWCSDDDYQEEENLEKVKNMCKEKTWDLEIIDKCDDFKVFQIALETGFSVLIKHLLSNINCTYTITKAFKLASETGNILLFDKIFDTVPEKAKQVFSNVKDECFCNASFGNVNMMKYLISLGEKLYDRIDIHKDEEKPFIQACRKQDIECINYIIHLGETGYKKVDIHVKYDYLFNWELGTKDAVFLQACKFYPVDNQDEQMDFLRYIVKLGEKDDYGKFDIHLCNDRLFYNAFIRTDEKLLNFLLELCKNGYGKVKMDSSHLVNLIFDKENWVLKKLNQLLLYHKEGLCDVDIHGDYDKLLITVYKQGYVEVLKFLMETSKTVFGEFNEVVINKLVKQKLPKYSDKLTHYKMVKITMDFYKPTKEKKNIRKKLIKHNLI